jgi:hypothetical protein
VAVSAVEVIAVVEAVSVVVVEDGVNSVRQNYRPD